MMQTTNQRARLEARKVTPSIGRRGFSIHEVAEMTTLSVPTVRNYIKAGTLRAKKLGSRVVVLSKDLDAFLEGQDDAHVQA